jgi:uncharacterized protein (TIGR02145 family)
MSDYSTTKARIFQWIGIVLLLAVFAGAYWYFQVRASTLNAPQNDMLTNGLVGLWSFNGDDISGTTAYDRSGSGNNGTLTNGPTKVPGIVGQALSFNGSTQYVTAGDPANLDPTGSFSLSTWVKTTQSLSGGTYAAIAGKGFLATTNGYGLFLSGDNSSKPYFQARTGGTVVETYGPSVNDGKWHLLTGVRDHAGNTNYLYIDGRLVGTGTGALTSYTSTNPFSVGARYSTIWQHYYAGATDEVRFYNRALTAGEIQSLYALGQSDKTNSAVSQPQGTGRLDSGLAGYWKLDENTGTSAGDSSTNGNTGTLTSGPTWGTGQIGSGVDFDGTDDYIDSIALTGIPAATDTLSIAFWAKTTTTGLDSVIQAITDDPSNRVNIHLPWSEDNKVYWDFGDINGAGRLSVAYDAAWTGQWAHWSFISQTGVGQKIYRNGTLIASDSNTSTFTKGSKILQFGRYWNGSLDEVRIYTRALSADEVSQLYRLTAPTSVDTSLKGYWSFNGQDISGTTAADRSGAGNNGTLTNSPTKVPGKLGQALNFDGTDDYIDAGSGTSLDFTTAFTLSAWVKTTSGASVVPVIFKGDSNNNAPNYSNLYRLIIENGKPTTMTVRASDSTPQSLHGTASVNDGNWHHIAGTFNSATNLQHIYVDGALDGSSTTSGIQKVSTSELYIGADLADGGGYTDKFPGSLDEVRVYNRALSTTEIQSLYTLGQSDKTNSSVSQPQGTGRLDSSLTGYWRFDENTGTSAGDSSVNGATATLTNGATWVTGQIGTATHFDGTNDYVDAGTAFNFTASDFTVAYWVNLDTFVTNLGGQGPIPITSGAGYNTDGYYNQISDDGRVYFITNQSGAAQSSYSTAGVITVGTWHHVTFVRKGASVKIYVNGIDRTLSAGTHSNPAAPTANFRLGCYGGGSICMQGAMDEVRGYGRALSADEVSQLYRLNSPTGTDTSLKGYWSFNGQDISGTTAADRSGAGNNGTLTNGPTKVPGKLGQAIDFDGTDDYVMVADNTSLDVTDTADLTLSGWFNRDTFTDDDTIIAKRNGIANTDDGYILYLDATTDQLIFEVSENSGTDEYSLTSTTTFTTPGWHHYAVVWDQDSAANSEIYINGATNGATDTGTIGNIGNLSNDLVVHIGAESDTGSPFNGKLDETRIYNRVLSASEIWSLYRSSGGTVNTCKSPSVTDADGNVYDTLQINSQCWMKQNMRVGTRIAASGNQTNNATTEKYCYSNSDANCTSNNPNYPDGGLYQWDEAMQYVTTPGARGICPSGWHIPTDTEWHILEHTLTDSGQTCDPNRNGMYDCSTAGTKLRPGGTSGFEGNLAGFAWSGSFIRATSGFFWSSSESGASAWYRDLNSGNAQVNRSTNGKLVGFSVRCLQDSP